MHTSRDLCNAKCFFNIVLVYSLSKFNFFLICGRECFMGIIFYQWTGTVNAIFYQPDDLINVKYDNEKSTRDSFDYNEFFNMSEVR